MKTIVIATKNQGKAREYRKMFKAKGINVKTLNDFDNPPKIKETGHSFAENAMIKAKAVVNWLHIPSLADDSGLEVHSINNEPGIYSARYAGDHDDAANKKKLLKRLAGHQDRSATFVTCLVLLKPNGKKLIVDGKLNGEILKTPRGYNGFGYDPLFYVPSKHQTLAEMTTNQKDAISHRGIAARKMMKHFDEWWQD
ncbi:XTP/dITP diphosphatase [Acetilactobacillus jinshanensis]|uniref:dITP/XTP pyrophosphatase n=1 Tax=Acetilactobacillus jinshanensis TaxID=1720083 RepID=A0A4P6ZND7_9LACO|nr:XTP/dITP diphosphatase [Acetilactobacillus jinshanensis]QBP18730.1 XTP/dITP diphosphatase [Acetilactobacillus jinshanensis]URL61602.1 XTP/dITP diphosphatase [uncultured bacterium]